jgi:hypothetical protein
MGWLAATLVNSKGVASFGHPRTEIDLINVRKKKSKIIMYKKVKKKKKIVL